MYAPTQTPTPSTVERAATPALPEPVVPLVNVSTHAPLQPPASVETPASTCKTIRSFVVAATPPVNRASSAKQEHAHVRRDKNHVMDNALQRRTTENIAELVQLHVKRDKFVRLVRADKPAQSAHRLLVMAAVSTFKSTLNIAGHAEQRAETTNFVVQAHVSVQTINSNVAVAVSTQRTHSNTVVDVANHVKRDKDVRRVCVY
tara:strand:- start:2657 stop:3265 length:609 start_codon:yes stop_codon:yes gene_type:complete